ncbi:fungal-specific transcription factor domain-containing protein [Amylocystis lapponica]|nr:fungal-specific transcription factor domain-containing protein [Amylocystis lapponica]
MIDGMAVGQSSTRFTSTALTAASSPIFALLKPGKDTMTMPSEMSKDRLVHDQEAPTHTRLTSSKRARKAINCEPCRASKIKCDRNRPCSSCVLRGTTASCYQNQDTSPAQIGEGEPRPSVNPVLELSRIRQSLALLESHITQHGSTIGAGKLPGTASTDQISSTSEVLSSHLKLTEQFRAYEASVASVTPASPPGILGHRGPWGLYSGPTSLVAQFISDDDESEYSDDVSSYSETSPPQQFCKDQYISTNGVTSQVDLDLLALLPSVWTIDKLLQYHFDNCNWLYGLVDESSVLAGWSRFKSGQNRDRVILCTVVMIVGLTFLYLPNDHELRAKFAVTCTPTELCERYYVVVRGALRQIQDEAGSLASIYTEDLVQLLLIKQHYMTFARDDPEEAWSLHGVALNIATAMGLHRDPCTLGHTPTMIGRRRWLWWRILLIERWQAFIYGRPLSIHSHHFNTQLPGPDEAPFGGAKMLHAPNIELFRLAAILGAIMEDAVSFRTINYSSVEEKDKLLTDWRSALPPELALDDTALQQNLCSPVQNVRRIAVKIVVFRCTYYHIRFALHRPYTNVPASLDIAVSSASQLIGLIRRTRPDVLGKNAVDIPLYMNWGPFHIFSAAMFFVFELGKQLDHPAAGLYRENVRKAAELMEWSRGVSVSDKGLRILKTLAPLYSEELLRQSPEAQQRTKTEVINRVKTLAFPHLTHAHRASGSVPGLLRSGVLHSAHNGSRAHGQAGAQMPVSSMSWESAAPVQSMDAHYAASLQVPSGDGGRRQHQSSLSHIPQVQQQQQQISSMPPQFAMPPMYLPPQEGMMVPPVPRQGHGFGDLGYVDEADIWGSPGGMSMGAAEWSQLLGVTNYPDQGSQSASCYNMQQ